MTSVKIILDNGKMELCNSFNTTMMSSICIILNKLHDAGLFKDRVKGFTVETGV